MIRTASFLAVLGGCLVLARGGVAAPEPVWLTGEVRAANAEAIIVPHSNSWPVVLRYLVPEGTEVKPGDVLLRIDPGQSATQVLQIAAQIEQADARTAKEAAENTVRAADAEKALIDAQAALAKAQIDAKVPREFLSALDADRFRGEYKRAGAEFALKTRELAAALAAIERRRNDGRLEVEKLKADLIYHRSQVDHAEQRAEHAGVITIGSDPSSGQRYGEGASAYPGQVAGQVIGTDALSVRAYVLEPDRAGLSVGMSVDLHFDALPSAPAKGHINSISGAPEPRAQWGDGRYFSIDIDLDLEQATTLPLLPGMSVRVEALREKAP